MNAIVESLTLVDLSGQVLIVAILVILLASIVATAAVMLRYRSLSADLRDAVPHQSFGSAVLDRIYNEAQALARASAGELNAQGVVEHGFQSDLRGLLTAERFVKASPGLAIVLGLVGTFYGLTLSIGRLAGLVSGESAAVAEVTTALTAGLTEALSGMSVAFTTSLVGIGAAIVLTFLGVFFNLGDRRTEVMLQVESHLEKVLAPEFSAGGQGGYAEAGGGGGGESQLTAAVAHFSQSVARLENSVAQFDQALQRFSSNTRDFGEFNMHLKDNVQRMSLAFADFSDNLRQQAGLAGGAPNQRAMGNPPGPFGSGTRR